MLSFRKASLSLASVLILAAIGIGAFHGSTLLLPGAVALEGLPPTDQPQLPVGDDPCWFQKGEDVIKGSDKLAAQAKLRTERETYGYPSKTSLKDALALFNSEEKCVPFRGTLPPLTEDEVVAAIVAGPVYGSEPAWRNQKDQLWAIAVSKELPRGSLLVAESGACAYDTELGKGSVCVEGQRIYLFLGLDKNPRAGSPLRAEQVFLLRANYARIKNLKS